MEFEITEAYVHNNTALGAIVLLNGEILLGKYSIPLNKKSMNGLTSPIKEG